MQLVILLYSLIHLAWSNSSSTSPQAESTTEDPYDHKLDWSCGYGRACSSNGSTICHIGKYGHYYRCTNDGLTTLPVSIHVDSDCKHLNFQHNLLKSLKVGTFLKADSVEELIFSDNIISSIDNYTFAPFMSLTRLRLTRNKLSKVTPGMLNGLWKLSLLELGHNSIQTISPLSFRETPNLQELRLQFNPLFELPENLFRFLPQLEKLDLQNTGLIELPDNIFRPIPLLRWLSLATNMFENVPEKALSRAAQLQSLDLSENDFKLLLKGAFKRLSNLSLLYLNNLDRLTWIEEGAFAGLVKLKFLTCSYNSKLDYIDEYVFGRKLSNRTALKTPRIEKLYLRQNALRTFKSPIDVEFLSMLSFADLSENPWKCDCNLQWMKHLTKETQANIRCNSPRQLRGRTFDTLDPSELTCGSMWTPTTFVLIVTCIVAFLIIILAVSAVVCSRTRPGLYIRVKQKFSYDKVKPKVEIVDLEWDPSADYVKECKQLKF